MPAVRILSCVLGLVVLVTAAPVAATAAIVTDYVALGDSYSSGLGTGRYQHARCRRSALAYPVLWHETHASSLRFVACTGATVADVAGTQASALRAETNLVTLSVGGNDAGFVSVLRTCHLGGEARCSAAVTRAETFVRTVLPARLDALHAEIRRRAPDAMVVVVGYPRLFEPGPCPGGLSEPNRAAINRGADTLATVLAERAAAAGFTFLDARPRFAGHGVCAADPWLNDLDPLRLTESYHPNARGQAEGYLRALTEITG